MAVLRELWTKQVKDEEVKHASAYVLDLRNRIEETCKIAQKSLEKEGVRQKKHFDRHAKVRTFKPGDRVLLLLPCKNNKLEMAWRGPFEVSKRVGESDYSIKVNGKDKLFHANLLKRYFPRDVSVAAAVSVVEEQEEWEVVPTTTENIPTIPLTAEETAADIN